MMPERTDVPDQDKTSPSPGYDVVHYSESFRDQVIELTKHLWSPDPALNAAYLDWKHIHNPYIQEPLIYLALFEGRAVGMRAFCGGRWEAGDPPHTFLLLSACDLVIDPAHRNQGIHSKIMQAAFKELSASGHEILLSLSAGPATLMGSLAMGWRKVGPLEVVRCERRPRTIVEKALHAFMRWAARLRWCSDSRTARGSERQPDPFEEFDRATKRVQPKGSHVCPGLVPRSQEMAGLIARTEYNGRIRHVRDRDYFDWRFSDPLSRFRFLYWEDRGLEGYLVLQAPALVREDRSEVKIVDWEGSRNDVRADLLRAAVRLAGPARVSIWSAFLADPARELLREAGFRPGDPEMATTIYKQSLLVRSVRDTVLNENGSLAGRRLLDLSNWDLRELYSQ